MNRYGLGRQELLLESIQQTLCGFGLVQFLVVLARSASLVLQMGLPYICLFVLLGLLDRDDWVLGGLGSGDDGLGSF